MKKQKKVGLNVNISAQHRKELRTVTSETVLIDKALADKWLETNIRNRKMSNRVCRHIIQTLRLGHFMCNGETIIFDEDGNLCEGQHRLTAVSVTGIPIVCVVVYGVSRKAMDTLGCGKTRTVGDVLGMEKHKNHNQLAATINAVHPFLQGEGRNINKNNSDKFTAVIAKEILAENPEIVASVAFGVKHRKETPITHSTLATIHFLTTSFGGEVGKRFMDGFVSGVGLQSGSPILIVRNFLTRRKIEAKFSKLRPDNAHYVIATLIKAWNAYATGRKLELKEFDTCEEYPVPVKLK
jgi:hypothetical protein